MAIAVYPEFKKYVMEAGVNWTTVGIIKVLLLKSGGFYSAAHKFIADVIAGGREMTGGSYSRQTVASRSVFISGGNVFCEGDPVTFSSLPVGDTIVAAVLQAGNSGSDAIDRCAAYYDGGTSPNDLPKATTGGDLTVTPHPTDGYLKL